MAEPIPVDDPDDPRLCDFVDLNDPDLRTRVETRGAFFVGEGPLVVARLLAAPVRVRAVLVTPPQHEALRAQLDATIAPVYVAPPALLRRVVGFDLHRGAVASVDRFPLPDVHAVLRSARRIAVLERVNDHENLGVIFRNAAGLGMDAVLLCPECADPLYRRTVRVSMGHVVHVPFTRLAPWPAALADLHDQGFATWALTPRSTAESIAEVCSAPIAPDARLALLFGAEGSGLRDEVIADADRQVRIPMADGVDSLNIGSAAAIAFAAIGRIDRVP